MGIGQKIKAAVGSNKGTTHHETYDNRGHHEELATGPGLATHEVHHTEKVRMDETAAGGSGLGATHGHHDRHEGMEGRHHTEGLESRGLESREHGHTAVGGESCGEQRFVQVEDRPQVKERVERIVEHHPVEREFVTTTKFVGEHAVPSQTHTTSLGVTERVVDTAQPGSTCPAPGAPIMDPSGEQVGRVGDRGTMQI